MRSLVDLRAKRKIERWLGSILCLGVLIFPLVSPAKTLIVEGSLKSRVKVSQQMGFTIDRPLNRLSFRFALPASFSNRFVFQKVSDLDIRFTPEPSDLKDETDAFGNRFRVVTWNKITGPVSVRIDFEVELFSELRAEDSSTSDQRGLSSQTHQRL